MSLRRVLGWIWAIVGRVLLYGTACLVIAFLFVRQEWEQRGRSWQGRGQGWWRMAWRPRAGRACDTCREPRLR